MSATDPLLEALRRRPDDTAAFLVYADQLQAKGDPRGLLVALQHNGQDAEAARLIEERRDELLGPLARYTKTLDGSDAEAFEWRLGFIRSARLSYDSNSVDDAELSLADALEKLLTHPSGALLEEIVVPINMLDDGCYFEPVCAAIAKHGAPSLRRLRLGEYAFAGPRGPDSDYDYEISWTSFGDMSGLWSAAPLLERFVVQGAVGAYNGAERAAKLGAIVAPHMQHVEIMSSGTSQENVLAVARATWPRLRHLDLWLGASSYGFTGGIDDVAPILAGEGLGELKHLGLMDAEYTDELCALLPQARILPQLEELSLALGTLTDEGAEVLARNAGAFAHLRVLDLEHCLMTDEGARRVSGLCANVRTGQQRDFDGEDRYVAVGE